ncbi:MAG: LLM class F420-dependent oxidoreductase [Acidimicrobiales bacterium]|jgi:probable F420-dependent oxidoreductase
MKIGIVYPQIELGGDPESVRRIARATEDLGFDHLLAYDHVVGAVHEGREPKLTGPYTEQHPFHDPFVLFGHVAGITERIELVTGVIILPQRQTALVAKQAADVDLFSGERFRMGVGTGWNYVEYEALGQDFHTRGRRADEQIEYLRRLWSEDVMTWEGEFDRIDRGNILPKPKRQIPLWVGGFSRPAFRRGARYGDGYIFAGTDTAVFDHLGQVDALLAEQDRDTSGFGKEFMMTGARSVDTDIEWIERWEAAGGTHATIVTMNMGLDSTEAHLDYINQVHDRLGR